MTTLQRAVVLTFRNTLRTFADHAARYAGISFLVGYVKRIQERLETIEALGQEQEACGTGVTAQKNRVRDLAIESVLGVAGIVAAWARDNGQEEVLNAVQFSRSSLKRMAQAVLLDRLETVHALAKKHERDLTPLGLRVESIKQLETRIEVYDVIVVAPRNAITRKKTLTELLKREIDGLQEMLNGVVDPLMLQFENTAPEFYTAYTHARKVVRPARTSLESILERSIAKKETAQQKKRSRTRKAAAKKTAKEASLAARRQRREMLLARSRQLSESTEPVPVAAANPAGAPRIVPMTGETSEAPVVGAALDLAS